VIHNRLIVFEIAVHRDPIITQKKMEFIRRNHKIFRRVFVTDFVPLHDKKWNSYNWSMKSKMASVMSRCYGAEGVMMSEQIRKIFGYNDRTSIDTILFTWRRLYFKVYEDERIYNGRRIC
jgi:hypothetical protein